jgi:hypothetical protein
LPRTAVTRVSHSNGSSFTLRSPVKKRQCELLWSLFVRRPSVRHLSSVNFYFKRHLLINNSADFIQSLQECSLGGHLWKLFKKCNSTQKEKNYKIFFLEAQRARDKISNMKHLVLSVYKVCSNKSPGVKIFPAQGVIDFPNMYILKLKKNLFKNSKS